MFGICFEKIMIIYFRKLYYNRYKNVSQHFPSHSLSSNKILSVSLIQNHAILDFIENVWIKCQMLTINLNIPKCKWYCAKEPRINHFNKLFLGTYSHNWVFTIIRALYAIESLFVYYVFNSLNDFRLSDDERLFPHTCMFFDYCYYMILVI